MVVLLVIGSFWVIELDCGVEVLRFLLDTLVLKFLVSFNFWIVGKIKKVLKFQTNKHTKMQVKTKNGKIFK